MARPAAKKIEPMRYDELLNSSSMEGLVSFINYRPKSSESLQPELTFLDAPSTEDISSTVDETSSVKKSLGFNEIASTNEYPEVVVDSGLSSSAASSPRLNDSADDTTTVDDISTVDVSSTVVELNIADRRAIAGKSAKTVNNAAGGEEKGTLSVSQQNEISRNIPSSPATSIPSSIPNRSSVNTRLREVASTVDTTSTVDAARISFLNLGRRPCELGAVWVSLSSRQTYEARKVQWVNIAQQSMTVGQERFYEAIWKAKSDYRFHIELVNRTQKRFRCGYDILARVTRIADRNVQKNIPHLVQKKILYSHADFDSCSRKGTSYDIFSYEEILRRQRAAGLCYIVKNGPGIEFAVPLGWTSNSPLTVDIPSTVDESSTIDIPSTGAVDGMSTITVDAASTPLDKNISNRQTTTAPPDLHEKLELFVPGIDAGAVERIWRESREVVIDIQTEEIAFWFEQRARMVYKNRALINPLGLLLSSIKDWITQRKVSNRRNQLRELAEEEQRVRQQLDEDQQKLT